MILRRLGNKSKLAADIIQYFPPHKIYIEPFFGAGGMFFNKPKAQYNIVNDIDSDVFNLFQVVSNQKEELEKAFFEMPIHQDLWKYWLNNNESDSIRKALRFLLLSNYGYMGKPNTLAFGVNNFKNNFDFLLNKTNEFLFNVQFSNLNFKDFFNCLGRIKDEDNSKTFIYCDPPYLGTGNNYSDSFTMQDSIDLLNILQSNPFNFAYSEFNNPFILEQAKERNLQVIQIGERQSMKNRNIEILLCNYQIEGRLFN